MEDNKNEKDSTSSIKEVPSNFKRTFLHRLKTVNLFSSCSPKVIAYKNVLGTGIPYMLLFSTQSALITLQSSLHDDQGLGLATLAILYCALLISGLFTSSIIQLMGTKYSLIVSYCFSIFYAITNFYPRWYTMVPGALINGLAQSPILASVNIHLTTIAIKYAPDLNEQPEHLIAFFTGLVTMFFKLAFIPGNLATTIILFTERHNAGDDIIDTSLGNVCNNTEENELNPTYVYILMSTFVLLIVIAIIITLLFMDHLGTDFKFQSCGNFFGKYVKDPFMSTLKMFTDWKIYTLLLMMFTDAFITSTTLGRLAKYIVSDCIGVHWVGIFSMCYGVSSAISALTAGRLAKWIPQFIMVYIFSAMLLGSLLFIIFWEREPSHLIAFLPTVVMGLGEGMWNSVPPTLVGILFPTKKEPAYSVLRMGFASGFIVGFTTALFIDIQASLWLEVSLIVVSLIAYTILVFVTHTKQQLLPACCFYFNKDKDVTLRQENISLRTTHDEELEDLLESTADTNDDTIL